MRRITTWLVATLAVVAMATYYQVSLSGDGKADTRPAATAVTPAAPGEGDKADDPDAQTDHTGKPGESKSE